MEQNSAVIQQFLNFLKFEKRFSEHTAKCYGADLRQFGEFLMTIPDSHVPLVDSISLDHHTGVGPATAVATQTEAKLDQLLLNADVNSAKGYLAYLNEKNYSKATFLQ